MKNKDFLKDLQLKSREELQSELENKRKELFFAKIEHKSGKLKNYKKLGQLRCQIAQILNYYEAKN